MLPRLDAGRPRAERGAKQHLGELIGEGLERARGGAERDRLAHPAATGAGAALTWAGRGRLALVSEFIVAETVGGERFHCL